MICNRINLFCNEWIILSLSESRTIKKLWIICTVVNSFNRFTPKPSQILVIAWRKFQNMTIFMLNSSLTSSDIKNIVYFHLICVNNFSRPVHLRKRPRKSLKIIFGSIILWNRCKLSIFSNYFKSSLDSAIRKKSFISVENPKTLGKFQSEFSLYEYLEENLSVTVMLVTSLWWFSQCIKSVTNILNLSPIHLVSNIRHQHRCNQSIFSCKNCGRIDCL